MSTEFPLSTAPRVFTCLLQPVSVCCCADESVLMDLKALLIEAKQKVPPVLQVLQTGDETMLDIGGTSLRLSVFHHPLPPAPSFSVSFTFSLFPSCPEYFVIFFSCSEIELTLFLLYLSIIHIHNKNYLVIITLI